MRLYKIDNLSKYIFRYKKYRDLYVSDQQTIKKYNGNWKYISEYQTLSESFIERYKNKVDWEWISANQKLSEKFIEKHKDKVSWEYISQYQKLSDIFINKYIKIE